ncbi:MAG TPA: hypothetical protein DCW44_00815 [Eubacterium sp.]|nr:hypothetical protein [Eubacterium sp.]
MKRSRRIRIFKSFIAMMTSFIILVSSVAFPDFTKTVSEKFACNREVNAYVDPGELTGNVPITSLKALYEFAKNYHDNPSGYQTKNLVIGMNEAVVISPTREIDGTTYTWYPIGTVDKPFAGKVTINLGQGNTQNIEVNEPLFDYIYDSTDIANINDDTTVENYEPTQILNLVRNSDVASGETKPLFANHVVHNTATTSYPSKWHLIASGTGSYSGIIGTVGTELDNTVVNLDLTINNTSSTIQANDNAGFICGTIKNGATVNVEINAASTGTVTDVTSDNANAGFYVGEMCQGSNLNVIRNNKIAVSDASRTVSGKTYAGGLVGKNDQGTVVIKNTAEVYDALGTITATDGSAGGVFGYYKITADYNRFSPDYYRSTVGCTLKGKTAGGLIGELVADGIDASYSGADSSHKVDVVSTLSDATTNYGGVVGLYSNTDLKKTFSLEHINVTMKGSSATNYGGGIGNIGGNAAVYTFFDDFSLNSTGSVGDCTYFGGVVGTAGNKGSLIDVGNITITTSNNYKGGGVVGKLSDGVLRLSGTTNLSGANANSGGQIVGERTNALVYALGNGNDASASYENGWRLVRSSNDVSVDDIGVWGEVVRIDDVENDILTYNSTAHTVTVAAAVTDIKTKRDFVKTAINMQLNDNNKGALKFDGSSKRTTLLAGNLTVFGTINLKGTGITGFMRDGAVSNDTSEIKYFTGKLSKGYPDGEGEDEDAIIKLAVGERYGVLSNGNEVTDSNSNGRGAIHRHRFNGLFARTSDGVEIENITIDGFMNIRGAADNMRIGGAIAYLENDATITDVKVKETINYTHLGSSVNHYVGGLIGVTNCDDNKTVTVKGNSSSDKVLIAPTIKVDGTGVNNADGGDTNTVFSQAIGGLIGYISSAKETTTTIENITLSANVDASGASAVNYVSAAGLISDIAYYETVGTDTRTLNLKNIDVIDTVIKNKAVNASGGILGYRWFGTDVNLENVVLSSDSTGNEINTSAKFIGGLVYKATGNWYVPSGGIDIESLNIKNGNSVASPTSLGILVHNGYVGSGNTTCGIFMELTASDSYTLASGMTIPTMTSNYDELVFALADDASKILTNNTAGVISYATGGEYSSAEGTKNSYNNVYNTTVVNNKSRYYYNADRESYTNNGSDDEYKLLFWSLNHYAASNIKRCFTNPFPTEVLSGTFDLKHISYYPIDISKAVTIGDADFIFYNAEIEDTETDSNTKRSTRSANTQHYLMHMGLFKNVSATINTTGDITMYGSVGVDNTYSGALINGTLTGTLKTAQNKNIILGSTPKRNSKLPLIIVGENIGERFLFINSIGSKATLDLNGICIDENGRYSPSYTTTNGEIYASSLIGNVQGIGINLRFNNIKLDSRKTEDSSALDDFYMTTKSIFKNATLLNKYDVDSTSVAIYNFSQSEDWDSSSEEHIEFGVTPYIGVTYGKELTDTVEYRDESTNLSEEDRYYEDGEEGNYIDPENYPTTSTTAYDFSSNFLPYVRYYNANVSGAPTATNTLREIKVNVVPSDLRNGCGTYDHPYEINGAKQFVAIANMLDAQSGYTPIPNIMLPVNKNDTSHWCLSDATTHSCKLFTYNGTNYTATGTNTTWEKDDVRKYLAKAYYQVGQDITLGTTFKGLGAYDSTYAFKGVIVGKNSSITITNKSRVPFIKISNGSVVKNLKIVVDNYSNKAHQVISSMTAGSSSTAFGYGSLNFTYVYGGVIGNIMGGDNIIDNVSMTYSSNNTAYIRIPSSNLACVGGYVGVVVNGGLIFRNMNPNSFVSRSTINVNNGSTPSNANWTADNDYSHLFVNPYVGRVINGYAINETTTYSGDTNTYILDNGTKNYQIADVKVNVADNTSEKLNYDTFDSKNRVNIPTGQSLFILSLITQSGAGTATTVDGNYAYGVGYDGSTQYNGTSAAKNVATHVAEYDKVGKATFADKTAAESDYVVSKVDKLNDKTAIPYIIYHYTKTDSNGKYPARMMTGATDFMKLSTAGGTYNLPKSFRGIGSICRFKGGSTSQVQQKGNLNYTWVNEDEDGKFAMKIYGFEGNNSTININLLYNIYYNELDNYSNTVYTKDNINLGFGLFNYVIQKSNATTTMSNALSGKNGRPETSVIPNYNLAEGYYIGNFTLSGNIKVKEYKNDGTVAPIAYSTNENKNQARRRFSVGGIIGALTVNNYVNFFKLDMSNVSVEGANDVGGYIGRNNVTERNVDTGLGMNYIYANACNATNLTVTAHGGYCGGMVAGGLSGFLDLFVNTAPNMDINDTTNKGNDGYYKSNLSLTVKNNTNVDNRGTGGVLGAIRNGYMSNLWINNVSLSGNSKDPIIENSNNTTTDTCGAGGLIGYVRKADTIILTNCDVSNINISGPSAGGLTGCIAYDTGWEYYGLPPVMKIYNCKVFGNDKNTTYSISGRVIAGGIAGNFMSNQSYLTAANAKGYDYDITKNNVYRYDIDGCDVYGYTIISTANNNANNGAGGVIGYSAQATRTVVNTRVHDCIIQIDGSQSSHGMGSVVGNTIVAIWGYNIAAYNNSFAAYNSSGTNAKYGGFIGNSNSKELKIVGFTRKNNKLNNALFSADYGNGVASGSYIIDADYMNVSIGNNHGNSMAVGFDNGTNVGEGAAKNYFPYVTVSPKTSMGGNNFLTGDGVNIVGMESVVNNENVTNNVPIAKLIASENKGTAADNRIAYKTVGNSDINTVEKLISRGEDTSNDYDIKLTTYFREMGVPTGYEGSDFPIISINDASKNYNDYINAYIRTLTNTTDTYTADISGKYSIAIYPCQCINGVYQKVSGTTGFQRNASGNYIMDDTQADSIAGNNQISMIDVSFLDPTDASKTAYHLYVPVLTKKVLKFNFSSTALQGTEYEKGVYEDKIPENWGDRSKLGAGFDSWQTIYTKFEYTKEEMDEFLKTGKGLNWNTSKSLQFKYNSNKSLATSTEYVLLDNNYDVDKQYYKTKAADDTNTDSLGNKYDVINFGEFAGFSPQKLMHIAADKLDYTQDNNGAYVTCNANEATVIALDGSGNEVYFKEGNSGTRYTITVKDGEVISETYYLSMYTYGDDNVITATTHDTYGLTVECPMTFTSNVVTCQRNNAVKNTEIYLGDFLQQTLTISEINDNAKITTDNHVINAMLTSTITFAGDSKVYFNEHLAGEKLYQNFYLYLNRYDEQGDISDDCTIKGNPLYTYTRTVDGSQFGATASGGVDTLAPYFYIEPVEIEVDYTDGENWSSTQTAVIALDFGTNEAKLIEEFPARVKATNDYRGIGLDATSKIDFAQARVKYSNNTKNATDPPNKRYYIDRTAQNGVLTLTALEQPEYDGYDAYGEQSKNKSSLGINGKYIETGSSFSESGYLEHIDVGLDYDITNLPDEVLNDGGYNLDFTITLEQKENSNASPGYVYNPVNIEDLDGTSNTGYLDNFKFMDKSDAPVALTNARGGEQQDGYLYYTYSMPLSTNRNNWTLHYTDNGGQKHFTSNLSFDVKTEDLLKAIDGYKYANYRIKVTATISKGSTAYLSEDHVVYTNARVNAEYVVPSN